MVYLPVTLLCNTLLFLCLLYDRFRFITTAAASVITYILSLVASSIVKGFFEDALLGDTMAVAANALLLFIVSLFVFRNNVIQKLFLAILCVSNFTFSLLFTELMLGIMPFKAAGLFSGIFSVAVTVLFTLLSGLLLYKPFSYFKLRDINFFIIGISIIQFAPLLLSYGSFDFLFPDFPHFGRIIASFFFYFIIFFSFRSVYKAARFKELSLDEDNYEKFLSSESARFSDILTYVQTTRSVKASYDSAMNSIDQMISNGETSKARQYISNILLNSDKNPTLEVYSDNPYVSSVIAMNALRAEQIGLSFSSHANVANAAMRTSEICVITDELLQNACKEAAEADGSKRVSYTVVPTGETLTFEAAFSSNEKRDEKKFKLKGKNFSDILNYLLSDAAEGEKYPELKNTVDIVNRYSGKLKTVNSGGTVIISVTINC